MVESAGTAGVLLLVSLLLCSEVTSQGRTTKCVDEDGMPRTCYTEFANAAFNKTIIANNTCGSSRSIPSRYCLLAGFGGAKKKCQICNASDPDAAHPANYITDVERGFNGMTWWQSESLFENKDSVWISVDLGKTFDVSYIKIRYHSLRPHSFKISKKVSTDPAAIWLPYQYYSASCKEQYNVANGARVPSRQNRRQDIALCTDKYSGMFPLSGGSSVQFSTLRYRPGAYQLDRNTELQDWMTASAIKIDLDKHNTLGDETFGEESVLRSYYYAISNLEIAGRCKCNGHAAKCVRGVKKEAAQKTKLVCSCEHHTAGDDCEKCAPLYNDRPWLRATRVGANPCQRCECNDLADACTFDPVLYKTTKRGGRCVGCRNNTAGINCEKCKLNYYRDDATTKGAECKPCRCKSVGSTSLQCNAKGICPCRPGIAGDKCDRSLKQMV